MPRPKELLDWSDLQDDDWPTLLLGNGLSINLWSGFAYSSLLQKAQLSKAGERLFAELDTTNFELVLEALHYARISLRALDKKTRKVDRTYRGVRDSLFRAVNRSHVPWNDFPQSTHKVIARNLAAHSSVFTTSYDLCIYWSVLQAPRQILHKDLLWGWPNNTFDPFDTEVSNKNATVVYYPHGGLHLWTNGLDDGKWTSDEGNLLTSSRYNPTVNRRPLFVSEGDWKRKVATIRRSLYLSHCLDALELDEENTVVFGQSLSDQDTHIVDALNSGRRRNVAVGIYPRAKPLDIAAEKARIEAALPDQRVRFFDSTSHPLGDPSLTIKP